MNIAVFAEVPWHIQLHALSALAALIIGSVQMLAPKGLLPHRVLGVVFILLMITVATTATFIRQINDGSFSLIHIFVPMTFLGLWGLVRQARTGRMAGHLQAVRGLFFGALLIPGLFAFLPGRLMWAVIAG